MSKEQTPIEELIEQIKLVHGSVPLEDEYFDHMIEKDKEHTKAKVLEAQNYLIQDIKEKVAKLEENTNTTDFAFDVINLLKSIKPLTNG